MTCDPAQTLSLFGCIASPTHEVQTAIDTSGLQNEDDRNLLLALGKIIKSGRDDHLQRSRSTSARGPNSRLAGTVNIPHACPLASAECFPQRSAPDAHILIDASSVALCTPASDPTQATQSDGPVDLRRHAPLPALLPSALCDQMPAAT